MSLWSRRRYFSNPCWKFLDNFPKTTHSESENNCKTTFFPEINLSSKDCSGNVDCNCNKPAVKNVEKILNSFSQIPIKDFENSLFSPKLIFLLEIFLWTLRIELEQLCGKLNSRLPVVFCSISKNKIKHYSLPETIFCKMFLWIRGMRFWRTFSQSWKCFAQNRK